MPRKRYAKKHENQPDPVHSNLTVTKFINNLMTGGKKSTAEGILYGSFKLIEERTGQPGLTIFKAALTNAKSGDVDGHWSLRRPLSR